MITPPLMSCDQCHVMNLTGPAIAMRSYHPRTSIDLCPEQNTLASPRPTEAGPSCIAVILSLQCIL